MPALQSIRALLRTSRAVTEVRRTKAYQTLVHWHALARWSGYRSADRAARDQFRRLSLESAPGLREDLLPPEGPRKRALLVRTHNIRYAGIQSVVVKALQLAGFESVFVGKRQFDVLRYDWLVGNEAGYTFSDFGTDSDPEWIDQQLPQQKGLQDWLALQYQGVHVGRIVLSTVLRNLKVGRLDYQAPNVQASLRAALSECVRNTRASERLLEAVKPDCVIFVDRGYSGQGELFDLVVNRGIDALTWDVGYKGNRMIFKRYNAANRRDHQLAPSVESWQRLTTMRWKPEYGEQVRKELFQCYESQEWFAAVGTQVGKQIFSRDKTFEQLKLSRDKKVAVIFPHIVWDGSFFFGDDLFGDYAEWLVETIRAACANDRLQWVVKLHPAHVVKSNVEGHTSKPAEIQLLDQVCATLPDHVKLVPPDTNISTYSLYEIADYCVTVRGTVGIESALFGIQTVTAGTGRYDRRGFTIDSTSREEYLQKLARLETYPEMTAAQRELAERYAYAVFLCRPLPLTSVSITFDRDGKQTPRLTVKCRTREEWSAAPDMRLLADFLKDGKKEDMLLLPEES
jgi:hypothetical protein